MTGNEATVHRLGYVGELDPGEQRHAARVLLAAGLGEYLDAPDADGCTRCPEIALDAARDIAGALGLIELTDPRPNPRRLTSTETAMHS